jgi:starch synthase
MSALAPLYIKKSYRDEPSFRNVKVVFSIYDNDFKKTFGEGFQNRMLLKGIAKKDIAALKHPVDYTALCKLAIDYSDGIIQHSQHINPDLLEYARLSGKPFLEYQSEDFIDACNDFYDVVWNTEPK